MANLAEDVLTGPTGPAVTPLSQSMPERQGVNPEQADIDAFTATAGPLRRGARAAATNIAASLNGIIASTGEALGMTDFANDRFKEAKRYTDFANSVDHEVRDYGAVKDFDSLIDYALGNIGKGVVSSLPAIGLAVGLRRPVAGVLAGSFPQEAGEQALSLRDNPNVMATTTPGQRLGNAATKGAINAVLELGGAEGQAARKILNPKTALGSIGKAVAKSTVGEGVTEAGQEIVGQGLEQQLDPSKKIDPHQVINAGIAGAVGGGAVGGIAHGAAVLPGAVAGTVDELHKRLGKKEEPMSPDPEHIPEEATKLDTKEQVMEFLNKYDEKFQAAYGMAKDPAERQAIYQKAKDAFYNDTTRPHIDKVLEAGRGFKEFVQNKFKKSEQENKPEPVKAGEEQKPVETPEELVNVNGTKAVKFSDQENKRGPADDDILDFMSSEMDQNARDSASPEQLQSLQKLVRDYTEDPSAFKHVQHSLKKVFGDKFSKITDYAIERTNSNEDVMKAKKREIRLATMPHAQLEEHRAELIDNTLRTHMKEDYSVSPEKRKALLAEMGPRVMDFIEGNPDNRFTEAMKHLAKSNTHYEAMMNELEQLKDIKPTTSGRAFEGQLAEPTTNDEGDESRVVPEEFTTQESVLAGTPHADQRLNKVYTDRNEAEKGAEALRSEYGARAPVKFNVGRHGPLVGEEGYEGDQFKVVASDADQEKLTIAELNRVREVGGQSGLENGLLVVKTEQHPSGVKLNLVRLTHLMMSKEGQQTQEGGERYVADMFSRGMNAFIRSMDIEKQNMEFPANPSTEIVGSAIKGYAASAKKGDDISVENGAVQLKDGVKYNPASWTLPDNTKIAVMGGKTYTYGDIKVYRLTANDLAGITDADIKFEEQVIKEQRAAEHKEAYTESQLNAAAINAVTERKQNSAERQTYFEPHEPSQGTRVTRREDGAYDVRSPRAEGEGDTGIAQNVQTSPSRDVHERRQYNEDEKSPRARHSEEDTDRPVTSNEKIAGNKNTLFEGDVSERTAGAPSANTTRLPQAREQEQLGTKVGEEAGQKIVDAMYPGVKKKYSEMSNRIASDLGHEGIAVTHDSPIRHEGKFDWRKNAGKGEGMMAVGAGTYFSTAEGVHKHYKRGFSESARNEVTIKGVGTIDGVVLENIFVEELRDAPTATIEELLATATKHYKDLIRETEQSWNVSQEEKDHPMFDPLYHEDQLPDFRRILGILEKLDPKDVSIAGKKAVNAPSYHGVLDAKPEEIMDWDAPLSEQSEHVQRALKKAGAAERPHKIKWEPGPGEMFIGEDQYGQSFGVARNPATNVTALTNLDTGLVVDYFDSIDEAKKYIEGGDLTGAAMYRQLSDRLGGDAQASDALQKAGIVGHKYSVGTASGNQNKNSPPNYVVYDDSKVNTLFVQLSTQNVGKGDATPEQQQAARDYVKKVLGDKAEVFFEKMAHAGEFAKINDIETIKIAINALDPQSVAYHEALHALFERLVKADKKTANTLLRAAGSAPIVARLRQLLKDHPRALEQLKDPEERLAYMYQFSAMGEKGLIQIGPETRTAFGKVKAFFRKVGAIWSDEMADAMAVEKAGDILDAFHEGKFANRNTVAEVLRDKFPMDPEEKARKVMPALGKFMDKFIYTASGAIRDTNDPGLTDIANKFHAPTEGGEPGYLQTRHTTFNRFMNRVNDALKGLNFEQLKNVLVEMQSGKFESEAAQKLRSVLDDAHRYLQTSGVKRFAQNPDGTVKYKKGTGQPELEDIGFIENYFPRVSDSDYVRNHKKEFIDLMNKHKISDPEGVWKKYAENVDEGSPREEDYVTGLAYYTPATGKRTLNDIPDSELAPFLAKDIVGVMSQYLSRAARRGEYTKRFGNSGEKIDEAIKTADISDIQKKSVEEAVRAMEGTLGSNMSKELKSVYGALTTYQNIRLLPLALFSSFVDPLGIMVRGGTMKEAGGAFIRGIRELAGFKDDDAYQLAATIGSINTAHDAQVIGDMYSSQFMPTIQKRINDKFFRMIGMESYNRSMRVAATAAAEQFLIRHGTKPTKDSERYLSELGLTKDDISVVNEKLALNDKVMKAMNMWVDQAILRPNAALRPTYMSDPNWILISHLKQYTYLFQKVIIARVHHELQHGNYTPMYSLMAYVPMIIASDMLRVGLTPGTGDDHPDWDIWDWLQRGVQRAGFFGPGQYAIDSANDFSTNRRFAAESIVGPTGQQLFGFLRASLSGEGIGSQIKNAIPIINKF